jgi:hypothetical protein
VTVSRRTRSVGATTAVLFLQDLVHLVMQDRNLSVFPLGAGAHLSSTWRATAEFFCGIDDADSLG